MTTNRKSIVTKIALKLLYTDSTTAQRVEGVTESKIRDMVKAFDPDLLGLVIVSAHDDGRYSVLDGAHRTEAARRAGYDEPILCKVFYDLTVADENFLFDYYNRSTSVTALSKFTARSIWGDPVAVNITKAVESNGWQIKPGSSAGRIACVNSLESVYRSGGGVLKKGFYGHVLYATMAVISEAWGHDNRVGNLNIVKGVGQLIGRYGLTMWPDDLAPEKHLIDVDRLIDVLGKKPLAKFLTDARAVADVQSGSVPAAFAKNSVAVYNKGLRTQYRRLPEWTWTR